MDGKKLVFRAGKLEKKETPKGSLWIPYPDRGLVSISLTDDGLVLFSWTKAKGKINVSVSEYLKEKGVSNDYPTDPHSVLKKSDKSSDRKNENDDENKIINENLDSEAVPFLLPSSDIEANKSKSKEENSKSKEEDSELNTNAEDYFLLPSDNEWVPVKQCTTGRVYMLKFNTSSERVLFWLQEEAEPYPPNSAGAKAKKLDIGHHGIRDRRLSRLVNRILESGTLPADLSIDKNTPYNSHEGDDGNESDDMLEEFDRSRRSEKDYDNKNNGSSSESKKPSSDDSGNSNNSNSTQSEDVNMDAVDIRMDSDRLHNFPINNTYNVITEIFHAFPREKFISIVENLNDEELGKIVPLIPKSLPPTKKSCIEVVRSPMFTQAIENLSEALRGGASVGISEVISREFSFPYCGEGIQGFLDGVRHAVRNKTV